MIESIEGKRGLPRYRPASMAPGRGLFGTPGRWSRNVETLLLGARLSSRSGACRLVQFLAGRHDRKGFRSFSVSGRVKESGRQAALAAVRDSARADRTSSAAAWRTVIPSRPICPAAPRAAFCRPAMADIPLDFLGTLEKYGCFVGSHAVVILSDRDDMKAVALNLIRFFGGRVAGNARPAGSAPRRRRSSWPAAHGTRFCSTSFRPWMRDASICGLGKAAPNPLLCVLKYFPEELEQAARELVDATVTAVVPARPQDDASEVDR